MAAGTVGLAGCLGGDSSDAMSVQGLVGIVQEQLNEALDQESDGGGY
jgi:hypothetical protein